jgi:S-adenosylmethionine hydrolase
MIDKKGSKTPLKSRGLRPSATQKKGSVTLAQKKGSVTQKRGPVALTLTTDFGYQDPFVGMMKGVILGINPSASITDITHGITPQSVTEAALVIGESYRYFPEGTIHVVVVDPGVGSGRRPILASSDGHFFIGPDNGVLTAVFGESPVVIHLTEERYFLRAGGSTFHGRDVFAPAAAWLSRGVKKEKFGRLISDYITLHLPTPRVEEDGVKGEVLHIDRFGNAITNIRGRDLEPLMRKAPALRVVADRWEMDMRRFYSDAGDNKPHALINSSGYLEIFIYKGSAAAELGLEVGGAVSVKAPTRRG